MKYASIDLETTGLEPRYDQILQIGVVVDDLSDPKPIEKLPCLNLVLCHARIFGHPFALAMNAGLIEVISKKLKAVENNYAQVAHRGEPIFISPKATKDVLANFLHHHFGDEKITVAGKNVGGFDLPFLEAARYSDGIRFAHRCLDVGPLYVEPGDPAIPDLKTVMERAGLNGVVTHDAVDDARVVVAAVRHKLARPIADV